MHLKFRCLERDVVIVLRSGEPGRTAVVARMLRTLLPAAVLVVAAVSAPQMRDDGAIVIDIDCGEIRSGPLWLADTIVRRHASGSEAI